MKITLFITTQAITIFGGMILQESFTYPFKNFGDHLLEITVATLIIVVSALAASTLVEFKSEKPKN